MPTHAELTAELLKDAAAFFKTLAAQNEDVRADMTDNAAIYERMAGMLVAQPHGRTAQNDTYASLAAKLLRDTATFFRKLASQNEPIREQMEHNAGIYEQIADFVNDDPTGIVE